MLRLKGVTIFDETKEFYLDRVVAIDGSNGNWWVEIGSKTYVLDPATIQPADDTQLVSAAPDMLACLKMVIAMFEANRIYLPRVQAKIMQVIDQAEVYNGNQCADARPSCPGFPDKSMLSYQIQPADDPRKAMLEEIRAELLNTWLIIGLSENELGCEKNRVDSIMTEMEAKL